MRVTSIPRSVLAFSMLTLLGGPVANGDFFVWVGAPGAGGADWCDQNNWFFGTGYPGQNAAGDSAMILSGSIQAPLLDCDPPFPISDLFISGGGLTVPATRTLIVSDAVVVNLGGTLNVSGTLTGGDMRLGVGAEVNVLGVVHAVDLRMRAGSDFVVSGTASISGKLTIEPDGELKILAGGLFEQTGDAIDEIGGDIFLCHPFDCRLPGGGPTFCVRADVVLGPYAPAGETPQRGTVHGEHPDARIQIQQGQVLTNEILIRGMMTVELAPPT